MGLTIDLIANIGGARELAFAPNGDLFVGTEGDQVFVVPNADGASNAGTPQVFATIGDAPDAGIAFSPQNCSFYVGTQHGVWRIPYTLGDRTAQTPVQVASVRTGPVAPGSDGDVHTTTSVAVAKKVLYASVGSSCDACVETDPTRASIQAMNLDGSAMATRATRIRNAIALAVDPVTGALWAGGAGQDRLPAGHPYEYMDNLSAHTGIADYGWPDCEENHVAYTPGANCANTIAPAIELPAYSTIIGAAFYPVAPTGAYALPSQYDGGLFITAHGSWHDASTTPGLTCAVSAQVVFVPMHGDTPVTPVNWSNPTVQWKPFVTGFQTGCGAGDRIGRPTGVAVGPQGDLFVADDQTGNIYRIRP